MKTAFIYPGQGAQKIGMGKDFYESYEMCQKVFYDANEKLDFDLKHICFDENDLINKTEYTQPTMVATCLAITEQLKEMGIEPDVTAGLSLGEYAAIAAAGGMSSTDAITTVRKRGIYMSEAVPAGEGAMAAVLGMEADAIEQTIGGMEDVSVANYNCPGQIVITGKAEAVDKASAKLEEAGARRVIKLNVSGPFHSQFLEGAGAKLREDLDNVKFNQLKVPYVANTTAKKVEDISETKNLLQVQVSSSVRWEQSMREMIDMGVERFVEIGPGKTLRGFLKKINKDVEVINISSVDELQKAMELLK